MEGVLGVSFGVAPAQLGDRARLDLANALARDAEPSANLGQGPFVVVCQAVAQAQDLPLPGVKRFEDAFDAFSELAANHLVFG